jgi:homoserine O-acetyltransferase/O-succinyltransferase
MTVKALALRAMTGAALSLLALSAVAADYPAPKEATFVARDFRFHTGEVMPEVRLHYRTIGDPTGQPVLLLHGTTGSGAGFLTPAFAGELFRPGQPLDATKYFIILPDNLGAGKSTKPSGGLRAKFPRYNYDDIVDAQHLVVTQALGIRHLRLVMGNSMGGMHTWMWGVRYPDFMDALVPMAAQPTEMSSRNWMMRRMLIDAIRNDPEYNNGDYTVQPKALKFANTFFSIATIGGTLNYQKRAPTREAADKLVEAMLAAPMNADANNFIYQYDSSRDYNPSPKLEIIRATLLAINAMDDERNPPETGIMEREIKRVKNGKLHMIPASDDTRGHGTTGQAKFYKQQLQELLQSAPRRTM